MANNLTYDANNPQLTDLEDKRTAAYNQETKLYNDALNTAKNAYEDAISDFDIKNENSNAYKQTELAKQGLNQTLNEIEQNKANTEKDYVKEQSAAYVDYQKQKNPYGVNAEKMASAGLSNDGYSESSKTSMYVAYQNRVSVARESFERAKVDYENQMAQAKLANDTLLAEIAAEAFAKKTELAIEWSQYQNTLLNNYTNNLKTIEQDYATRYQAVINSFADDNGGGNADGDEETFDGNPAESTEDSSNWISTQIFNQALGAGNHGASAFAPTFDVDESALNTPIVDHMKTDDYSDSKHVSPNFSATNPMLDPLSPTDLIKSKKPAVETEYYVGLKNKDADIYGTFSNGYQPKGISGHGKLTKSGVTYTFNTKTRSGEYRYVTQNVWKAEDGSLWYWDGSKNKYLPYHQGYRRST